MDPKAQEITLHIVPQVKVGPQKKSFHNLLLLQLLQSIEHQLEYPYPLQHQ
jgi:hypothetical protein